MSACLLCASMLLLVSCSLQEPSVIEAEPGDDVVLQCRGNSSAPVELLEWSREDLSHDFVFYFRDNLVYKDFQHESFHGRVELKDPQMKDGDASVILKNVNVNDTGTYKCRIKMGPKWVIEANVLEMACSDPVETTGHAVGLKVGLMVSVACLLLSLACAFVIVRKRFCPSFPRCSR